jgi:hypothetical protein
MKSTDIRKSLEAAIVDPALQDATSALAEAILDSSIENGILREIPIVGTIIGLGRAAVTIRDRLFLNKLRYLLTEIESVAVEDRENVISSINNSEEYSIKVGEKLLYIVDRREDHQAASLVGRVFRAFLEGSLDYESFVRLAGIIDKIHHSTVLDFAHTDWEEIDADKVTELIGTGLIELNPMYIRVEDQTDWKASNKYVVDGGRLTCSVTMLGRELRGILGESKAKPNKPWMSTAPSPLKPASSSPQ